MSVILFFLWCQYISRLQLQQSLNIEILSGIMSTHRLLTTIENTRIGPGLIRYASYVYTSVSYNIINGYKRYLTLGVTEKSRQLREEKNDGSH